MGLNWYTKIIWIAASVPYLALMIFGYIILRCWQRSHSLTLITMKGFVAERNVDRTPEYLVCNRIIPPRSRAFFARHSLIMIALCVQLFFRVAIVDETNECIHEPGLECFKTNADGDKASEINITDQESPVNCSSISANDFVTCYRFTLFDPERIFIAASAAYLLFKLLNFSLLIVSYIMVWRIHKLNKRKVVIFKFTLASSILILLFIPLIVHASKFGEVGTEFQQMYLQVAYVGISVFYYVFWIPWETFENTDHEYYVDVSLPQNVGYQELA